MAAGMLFSRQIVVLSGAGKLSQTMQTMSADYLFCYSAFSVPMLMSTCLSVFVRNDGAPGLSFAGMCTGALANVFLDWLFIFPLHQGVTGAAVASRLGQICSLLVLLTHFARKKGTLRIQFFHSEVVLMKKICRRGLPESVTQLAIPVTALCYNFMLASLVGDLGVSTFSVLSFISSLANAILSGVAQGLQPLWGRCFGRQETEELEWYFHCGLIINTILSLCIYGFLCLFDTPVIRIFNDDIHLVQTASADLIAVSRGIVLKALAIFTLPMIFGVSAIWIAPFAAEAITLLPAFWLCRKPAPSGQRPVAKKPGEFIPSGLSYSWF